MPSSSPRCAQFPRAQDKVHFYIKLKELRDQIKGQTSSGDVVETRYSFDLQLAKGKRQDRCFYRHIFTHPLIWNWWHLFSAEDAKKMSIKEEQVDPEYESCSQGQEDKKQSGWGDERAWGRGDREMRGTREGNDGETREMRGKRGGDEHLWRRDVCVIFYEYLLNFVSSNFFYILKKKFAV